MKLLAEIRFNESGVLISPNYMGEIARLLIMKNGYLIMVFVDLNVFLATIQFIAEEFETQHVILKKILTRLLMLRTVNAQKRITNVMSILIELKALENAPMKALTSMLLVEKMDVLVVNPNTDILQVNS